MKATNKTGLSFVAPIAAALFAACATPTPQSQAPDQDDRGPTTHRSIPNTVTQPVTFESPVIDSSVRPVFIHQELPDDSIFGGGDFQLYALQIRYAVNDRLAIIATKDGYIDFNPASGNDQDGFADIAAGVKYALVDEPEDDWMLTGGLIYEIDAGDHEVFQGNGDGLLRTFVSGAYEVEDLNVVGTFGFNLPFDGGDETHSIDYHLHLGYEICDNVMPFVEAHGISYTRNANNLGVNFEGGDLLNLGSTRVAGQSFFSGALGVRYQAADNIAFGAAYEVPLGGRDELMDQRITVDVLHYF